MKNQWPFPGDHPVSKARKMALAYRSLAQQHETALQQIREVLTKLDRRLLNYDSPASIRLLDQALKTLDAAGTTSDLDERFSSWGESWHAEIVQHYGPDDYVKADVAGQILHVSKRVISGLRIDGRLQGIWDPEVGSAGGYRYKVADIWELSTKVRTRKWRTTGSPVTLDDNGRSDTE